MIMLPIRGQVRPVDARTFVNALWNSNPSLEDVGALVEALIDRLDAEDGDPDLEDDDPAGDPLDIGEAQDFREVMKTLPVYGIDQSTGPINEREGYRAWQRELMRH